jgi:hypothetical protein
VTQSVLLAPPTFAEAKDPEPYNAVDTTGKSLEMRLSDAGLRQRQTKLIYPKHRLPPWLKEDAAPRSLEPIVRQQHWAGDLEAIDSIQRPQ